MNLRTATFTPETSLDLLRAACRAADLDPAGALLLRHHTNAVYRLARQPVIVKITRPGTSWARTAQTVAIAEALVRTSVPAVRPWPHVDQPITLAGSHATFWITVDSVREPTAADLAEPLLRLHQLDPADLPAVPNLDPFGAITGSLERRTVLDSDDLTFLRSYADQLHVDYSSLRFERPNRIVHGDAHHSNALVGPEGPVLADWESACQGPPEWDLVTVAVHCRRFGHLSSEYEDFATAYTRDIYKWPGYPTLTAVRELRMITTNAWKSESGSPAAAEVRRRVRALREGDADCRWRLL